nr:MAG TPA: hypothetical protein [Caudoviricetes sp.]
MEMIFVLNLVEYYSRNLVYLFQPNDHYNLDFRYQTLVQNHKILKNHK